MRLNELIYPRTRKDYLKIKKAVKEVMIKGKVKLTKRNKNKIRKELIGHYKKAINKIGRRKK